MTLTKTPPYVKTQTFDPCVYNSTITTMKDDIMYSVGWQKRFTVQQCNVVRDRKSIYDYEDNIPLKLTQQTSRAVFN